MTNYAPRKLRASVEKKDERTATHRITLNREVHLSEDVKHQLEHLANGGRSKCFVSVLQADKTVIEVSINRGPTGDAAVAFEKICTILAEVARHLHITPQDVTVVYLSGRIAAMTLTDMDDLVKRLNDSKLERRPRRSLHAMS